MREEFLPVPGGLIFVRRSEVRPSRPTIVFLHGLGESSLCFEEAFAHPQLAGFNLLAPDLLGYGRSSSADDQDYCFETQVKRIQKLLETLRIARVSLVGHSMGGDLAIHMAEASPRGVTSIVNVEGNLTPEDRFISREAVKADSRGDFERWFRDDFMTGLILGRWGARGPALRRYFASLCFCRPEAFLANAKEMCPDNEELAHGLLPIGARFCALETPKLFCWSDVSACEETQGALKTDLIPNEQFTHSFHWLMIDHPDRFYGLVGRFVAGVERGDPDPLRCQEKGKDVAEEMEPEYDIGGGVRGKYVGRYHQEGP